MKELTFEKMELLKGGWREPDAGCVIATGLEGAAYGAIGGAFTGPFWGAGLMGGWLAGVAVGLVKCSL